MRFNLLQIDLISTSKGLLTFVVWYQARKWSPKACWRRFEIFKEIRLGSDHYVPPLHPRDQKAKSSKRQHETEESSSVQKLKSSLCEEGDTNGETKSLDCGVIVCQIIKRWVDVKELEEKITKNNHGHYHNLELEIIKPKHICLIGERRKGQICIVTQDGKRLGNEYKFSLVLN
ncbi:hypothetical protein L1049_015351 [Liquidambar formosana]|uniref:Uncharacterized protein n=1 Tax=Liquidambar formosana TaxID=63359 RepID=A0AAP0X631_LIQFO